MSETPRLSPDSDNSFQSLERPAREFWQMWQQGCPPAAGDFLERAGGLSGPQRVAVLRVDQRERWLRGERVTAEAYVREYPFLQGDSRLVLDLVYGEYLLREELGEAPSLLDYAARFPALAEELRLQVELHRALWATPLSSRPTTPGEGRPPPHAPALPLGLPEIPGYEVLERLGQGGMGVVYKARQQGLNRLVALKMLRGHEEADPDLVRRLRAEAETVAQLRHPNIVQIYDIGEHDGRPYLALEFVEGGSLDRALRGTPQAARTAARLVQTLADAVQAAHQRGIIHRDLKPANVLIQESGVRIQGSGVRGQESEVRSQKAGVTDPCLLTPDSCLKIADFGLAKQMAAGAGQTHTGAVLGTPSYMAPEQAAAEAGVVGPATDVYALGAVLYELLTGRPPFKAATVMETLDQVRTAEPVPPRRLRPDLPADLETVCLKCLQKEPGKRYASARDLAADLARFAAGRPVLARPTGVVERGWRWCRRKPLVAGLAAAVVLAVLGGFGGVLWQWRVAEAHRAQAEADREQATQNFRLAREAVDRFCTSVSENRLLNEPGMEGLRKELLATAVAFYGQLVRQQSSDADGEAERGQALRRLAQITLDLGSVHDAQRLMQEVTDVFTALARRYPDNRAYRFQLALISLTAGQAHQRADQTRQAEAAYRHALAVLDELAEGGNESSESQVVRATVYGLLFTLYHDTGERDRADEAWGQARPVYERVVDAGLDLRNCRRNFVVLLTTRVFDCCQRARLREAAAAARRAVALAEKLVREQPGDAARRSCLAGAYGSLGDSYQCAGAVEAALANWRKALGANEALARAHPEMATYRLSWSRSYHRLALIHEDARQWGLAEKDHLRAERLATELLQSRPDFLLVQALLADIHRHLGHVYRQTGRGSLAEERYRRAIAAWEKLARAQPAVCRYREGQAEAWFWLEQAYLAAGRTSRAASAYRRNLDLWQGLARDRPGVAAYHDQVAKSQHNLAWFHSRTGHPDQAEAYYRESLATRERWTRAHPGTPGFETAAAPTYRNLGALYSNAGKLAPAETALHQALQLYAKSTDEDRAGVADAVAAVHGMLGNVYKQTGRPELALASYSRAVPTRERQWRANPRDLPAVVELSILYENLGALNEERRPDTALDWYGRQVRVLAEAHGRAPADRALGDRLARAYVNRAQVLAPRARYAEALRDCEEALRLNVSLDRARLRFLHARLRVFLGQHAGAAAEAAELAGDKAVDGDLRYQLACLHGLCIMFATRDARLSDGERSKVVERYGAAAVKLLGRLHADGHFRTPAFAADLKRNQCLDPLRRRKDFARLLAEVDRPPADNRK